MDHKALRIGLTNAEGHDIAAEMAESVSVYVWYGDV